MKIGYPCINRTIECKGDKTFRLKSYSEKRLIDTVTNNLDCLENILKYNIKENILFFRLSSDLIPFASHPICTFSWQHHFKEKFEEIGDIIKEHSIRISMHPDQFIVLNSPKSDVVTRSIAELYYHAEVLDLMKLDTTAKIQLHIGGAYNNKMESLLRFSKHFTILDTKIKKRLVIENDDKLFSLKDCFFLYTRIRLPILVDVFHHKLLNNGESTTDILEQQRKTWNKKDGLPMVDYSSQKPNARQGSHAESLNENDFHRFLEASNPYDFDIMLEIKDKEHSAQKAIRLAQRDKRYIQMRLNNEIIS